MQRCDQDCVGGDTDHPTDQNLDDREEGESPIGSAHCQQGENRHGGHLHAVASEGPPAGYQQCNQNHQGHAPPLDTGCCTNDPRDAHTDDDRDQGLRA